jgi:hypothetical protein
LLSEESCPKLLYLYLLKFVRSSNLALHETADVFAVHFDKFQFRYGFKDSELRRICEFMGKF